MTTPITMQYHLLPGGGGHPAYQPQPHQHRAPAPNNVMQVPKTLTLNMLWSLILNIFPQAGAPPFTPGGHNQFYPTQPPHSAPPQQQLIYQQGMQHAHMQAMQRQAQAQQQMGFPHMMVPGQPGQHPYGAHPLHMSQGPPQQPSHPAMGPPQQQAVQTPHFQPRGQSQGPPNQQGGPGGPGGSQQGPPQSQGQQPPRGGPGGADSQAPPPASTPPQGPPSLGHNGPPAPQQQPQPPQGPPAHSGGPPSGTSTLTRERKRIAIIDPTTRQEVSVDGTSADKKVGTVI